MFVSGSVEAAWKVRLRELSQTAKKRLNAQISRSSKRKITKKNFRDMISNDFNDQIYFWNFFSFFLIRFVNLILLFHRPWLVCMYMALFHAIFVTEISFHADINFFEINNCDKIQNYLKLLRSRMQKTRTWKGFWVPRSHRFCFSSFFVEFVNFTLTSKR